MVRHIRFPRVLVLFLLAVLLIPIPVFAQEAATDGFILQFDRPVTLAADESVDGVVLIGDNATIDGRITEALVVINGDALVTGQVDSDVVVIGGSLELASGATVNDVTLIRSDLTRADDAIVRGDITEQSQYVSFGFGAAVFSFVFWLGFAMLTILAGLAFVFLAGRHLDGMAGLVSAGAFESVIYGLATVIGLPLIGILALLTLIGFPVGIVVLLVLFPLVMLMGFLVASMRLGQWLATVAKVGYGRWMAVLVGVIVLQVAGLLPVVGGLVTFAATVVGTGALVRYLYRSWQARRHQPAPAAPVGETLPA